MGSRELEEAAQDTEHHDSQKSTAQSAELILPATMMQMAHVVVVLSKTKKTNMRVVYTSVYVHQAIVHVYGIMTCNDTWCTLRPATGSSISPAAAAEQSLWRRAGSTTNRVMTAKLAGE